MNSVRAVHPWYSHLQWSLLCAGTSSLLCVNFMPCDVSAVIVSTVKHIFAAS